MYFMKVKQILILMLFLVNVSIFAQEKTVTGIVSDEDGPLPGVSVLVKGTNNGTETDFDGKYRIKAKKGDVLVFRYLGKKTVEKTVGNSNTINVVLKEGGQVLDEVVVTALGIKKSEKSLPFASQPVKGEDLQKANEANVVNAIAGKVSGIQIRSQAGSKLGSAGTIRIRGAIGLKDSAPLYVVDGIPGVSPNDINMDNVKSINVLKGPSATALYGQRAQGGVIIIESIKGVKGKKFQVNVSSTVEVDQVDITAQYQNVYGGGGDDVWRTYSWQPNHPVEWQALNGVRYHDYTDDASWGPKYDGGQYIPWSAWYPGTKYSNKTTAFSAQPNNIRDFYNQSLNLVNNVSVTKSGEDYSSRVAFTNRDVAGIIPGTTLNQKQFNMSFNTDIAKKLHINSSVNISKREVVGDFNDDYGNGSAGSFNQWFHRDVNTKVLRELNYVSDNGRIPTWNLSQNPTAGSSVKRITSGNYWLNPYSFYTQVRQTGDRETVYGNLGLKYDISDNFSVKGTFYRKTVNTRSESKVPKIQETSAVQTGIKNSYGLATAKATENNIEVIANYNQKFGDVGVDVNVGGNVRDNYFNSLSGNTRDGLQIPDFFNFSNSVTKVSPSSYYARKQVRSLFAKVNLDYNDFLFLEGSYRKDYSSALPNDRNGYGYPSLGGSLVFSKFTKEAFDALTFGKLRVGWAQIGSDIGAYALTSSFGSSTPYDSNNPILTVSNTLIDPNIVVPINESFEVGTDLRFFHNRLGISYTYFNETKKDEIQNVSITGATGYNSLLTNAGSFKREGHELTIDATPIETDDFSWETTLNWATVKSTVLEVNDQVSEIPRRGYWALYYFTQTEGKEWGQIKGKAYKRDADGNKVIDANGRYVTENDHYFGSVLPDFTGGFNNTLTYKNFSLSASIDFQKGGLFYSLSSQWGTFSGLYEETAAVNDKGHNVREAVADGGGVRVDGVDETTGQPVTIYRDAQAYFHDFFFKRLTEKNLYDASYVKLREVSLTYKMPKSALDKIGFINDLSISVFGRNLGLLYKNNPNVDPSILSRDFGEYGQQPGTKTFGTSVKFTF